MRFSINLSNLILCPNQVIYDLIEQLGGEDCQNLLFKPVCELNTISDWVYLDDSFGDPAAHSAYTQQEQLSIILDEQKISVLELDLYLGDLALTQDNVYSLLLLGEALDSLTINVYGTPKNISSIQAFSTLCLTHKYKKIEIHYYHANSLLTSVSLKQQVLLLEVKQKQLLMNKGFVLDKLSENNSEEMQEQLIQYVWSCVKSGAGELACRVLESAVLLLKEDSLCRDEYIMQLTVIRFLVHRHLFVVDDFAEEPLSHLTESKIQHLYFIKAFSATLVRRYKEAALWYERANIKATTVLSDENSLYKLNLYALFLFLNGDLDGALNLEFKLLEYLQKEHAEAQVIKHVILMNIARLHKKEIRYSDAEEFYGRAYEQLQGAKFTLFDKMNQEMDKAILCEARGLIADALSCWIHVTKLWLSCSYPLVMPPRTRLVLCQERMIDTIIPLSCEKVNCFLLNKVNGLYVLCKDQKFDCVSMELNIESIKIHSPNEKAGASHSGIALKNALNKVHSENKTPHLELA